MKTSMITTVDNKFDPFDEWEKWLAFDDDKTNLCHQYFGCSSCELLDRYEFNSSAIAPSFAEAENERAIDEICRLYGSLHIFKKVTKDI